MFTLALFSPAEVVVSNLHRIRIRSNSTGAKHSSPREQGSSRRYGNQLETPDKQRMKSGGKVPKSASVSALSLIITAGEIHTLTHSRTHAHSSLSHTHRSLTHPTAHYPHTHTHTHTHLSYTHTHTSHTHTHTTLIHT